MSARLKKIGLFVLAVVLLAGSGQVQKSMNRDRDRLGLTRASVLENAPPLLAFTTVALGGFRGLISNYLWIRSNDLQLDDKFFEAAQLANWITDLEPHFAQVWAFEAWNMAFNISVKFKDAADRWRWVEQGMQLLRDRALRYNPDAPLLYQQLAWLYQFKMGQNLDDANLYYKREWAREMAPFFGPQGTNVLALLHPQTAGEQTNALELREKYRIDPAFAVEVNTNWGPLDWRLPEAHAIYWASLGLQEAKEHPDKVGKDDLMQLRRVIFQSMQQAFHQGRFIADPFAESYAFYPLGPNLDLIPNANKSYLTMMAEEPGMSNNIANAHRNFVRDAVYFLYAHNRMAEAARWYRYLSEQYPDKTILDSVPGSYPRTLTLDQYAVGRVQEDIGDTDQKRTTSDIQGLLTQAYVALATGQDDRFQGFKVLTTKVYDLYNAKMRGTGTRAELPPLNVLNQSVLKELLDPQQGLPYAMRAVIRTQLGMQAESSASPATATNSVENAATNSPVQ
ncbi:MAG TPA: hypothetical protein VN836_07515 [Verrucomicrobiae bacterium]|nr:hypothetical protein [Verrucomicrobiae bacterium]